MNKIKLSLKINTLDIADWAFILYFSNMFFQNIAKNILHLGNKFVGAIIFVPIVLVLFLVILDYKKYLKYDFILLFSVILLFFGATLLFHPEYEFFYMRDDYGIWDHVLIPYRGIYAYLFIRIVNDVDRICNNLRKAGCLMVIYGIQQVTVAISRGYWMGVGESGAVRMSYSVAFGYQMLPFALFFFNEVLNKKKIFDLVLSIIYLVLILMGGSRGTVLCIGIYFLLYVLISLKKSRRKIMIISIISSILIVVNLTYSYILQTIQTIFTRMGISSRFIKSLLSGNISDDNHRNWIWQAALDMIKDNPFGYGAMGSRHIIYNYIYSGYPHNIVLEFLIDYGVVLGTILLAFMFYISYRIFFRRYNQWGYIFLPFFASASCLLISMTYWSIPSFWACLAIGYIYCREIKKDN